MNLGKTVNRRSVLVVGAVVSLTALAAAVTLDNIPAKAREALLKLADGNAIVEVESEKEHGVQVYEASWRVNGKEVEAEVTADGILLETEQGVDAEAVPQAVRTAAETALAGADKIHYEMHTVVFYEVEGRVNGKNKEVKISPTGQVAGQEDDDEDEGDDEGDDDK
jgi:hypothetical protein